MNNEIPIICINSIHDKDKLDYINKYCPHSFSVFSTINIHSLTDEEILFIKYIKNNRLYNYVIQNLTHYRILNTITNTKLIIEDNIFFSKKFTYYINNIIIPDECDILYIGGQFVPDYHINVDTLWPCHKLSPYTFDLYYDKLYNCSNVYKRKSPLSNNLLDLHTWCIPISRHISSYIITPKGATKLLSLANNNKEEFISIPLNSFICSNGREGNLNIYEHFPHITHNKHGKTVNLYDFTLLNI